MGWCFWRNSDFGQESSWPFIFRRIINESLFSISWSFRFLLSIYYRSFNLPNSGMTYTDGNWIQGSSLGCLNILNMHVYGAWDEWKPNIQMNTHWEEIGQVCQCRGVVSNYVSLCWLVFQISISLHLEERLRRIFFWLVLGGSDKASNQYADAGAFVFIPRGGLLLRGVKISGRPVSDWAEGSLNEFGFRGVLGSIAVSECFEEHLTVDLWSYPARCRHLFIT